MIYIIFGASGSGKSTLLNIIRHDFGVESVHIKGTTRIKRQYDEDEIVSFPKGLPKDKYQYVYNQYGYKYGIEKRQIDNAIHKDINHFIICNDIDTIEKLKRDYPNRVRTIYLLFDAPKETIIAIQKKRHITDDEINLRIKKIDYLKSLAHDRLDLFDYTMMNKYGDNPEKSFRKQLENILNSEAVDNNYTKLTDEIYSDTNVEKNIPFIKDFLFIIMAMDEEHNDLDDIYNSIKGTSIKYGFNPERVNDKFKFSKLDEKILDYICMSELIVADLSYEKPNCYYEIGYAQALNKRIIYTAKKGTKVHFDVITQNINFYTNISELQNKLSDILRQYRNF